MTESTLNKNYAIEESQQGQSYPALQASEYQPRHMKADIRLGLSDDSLNMLTPDAVQGLKVVSEVVYYGESEVMFHGLPTDIRWVIIGRPSLFVFDKDSGKYGFLEKGVKLAGTKKVTISKLFLACVNNGQLLLDAEGKPQIFTLNLKSSKTELIGGYKSQPGDGSIASLNAGLCKHYQVKGWLTHLVSVSLKAVPEKFTSKSGDSSIGIKYILEGGAKSLSEDQQKMMFDLASDPDVITQIKDPFGLGSKSSVPESTKQEHASEDDMSVDYDEIPF